MSVLIGWWSAAWAADAIVSCHGPVTLTVADAEQVVDCGTPGLALPAGSSLRTGPGGWAWLQVGERLVVVEPDSRWPTLSAAEPARPAPAEPSRWQLLVDELFGRNSSSPYKAEGPGGSETIDVHTEAAACGAPEHRVVWSVPPPRTVLSRWVDAAGTPLTRLDRATSPLALARRPRGVKADASLELLVLDGPPPPSLARLELPRSEVLELDGRPVRAVYVVAPTRPAAQRAEATRALAAATTPPLGRAVALGLLGCGKAATVALDEATGGSAPSWMRARAAGVREELPR